MELGSIVVVDRHGYYSTISMQASIKIDSVFLSFGTKEVLKGVHLELKQDQVVGLLGRNGSGKSCLLKIITGQIRAQSAHIKYEGRIINSLYKEKGLINYLPQHECHPQFLSLSAFL